MKTQHDAPANTPASASGADKPPPEPRGKSKYIAMTCETAPGKHVTVRVPRAALATYGMVKLRRKEDGSLVPMVKTWSAHEKLTDDLPARLGLQIDSATLRVLCYAGFIKASRPSPFVTLINMESLVRHMEATEGDKAGDFWTEARRRQYRSAYLSGLRLRRADPGAVPAQGDLFHTPEA